MYHEIAPSHQLKKTIDSFWVYNNKNEEQFKILPDGCTDLIFNLNTGSVHLNGVMSIYSERKLISGSQLLGIRLKPGTLKKLTQIPADEFKNLKLNAQDIIPEIKNSLLKKIEKRSTLNQKIFLIENILFNLFDNEGDIIIDSVIEHIIISKGKVSIKELLNYYPICLRQLERKFKNHIGLTIKEFMNIIRFNNAKTLIEENKNLSFLDIAYQTGYFDHSHLTNHFKQIAGNPPSAFR